MDELDSLVRSTDLCAIASDWGITHEQISIAARLSPSCIEKGLDPDVLDIDQKDRVATIALIDDILTRALYPEDKKVYIRTRQRAGSLYGTSLLDKVLEGRFKGLLDTHQWLQAKLVQV